MTSESCTCESSTTLIPGFVRILRRAMKRELHVNGTSPARLEGSHASEVVGTTWRGLPKATEGIGPCEGGGPKRTGQQYLQEAYARLLRFFSVVLALVLSLLEGGGPSTVT